MPAPACLYGIDTCDQVRQARGWLRAHALDVAFHDFRQAGVSAALLDRWLTHLPWDALINRRSTTWRTLDPKVRAAIVDARSASAVLLEHPKLIKRPILEWGPRLIVGFSDTLYQGLDTL